MVTLEQRLEDIEYKIEVLENEKAESGEYDDIMKELEERIDDFDDRITEIEENYQNIQNNIVKFINKKIIELFTNEFERLENELNKKASTEEVLRLLLMYR